MTRGINPCEGPFVRHHFVHEVITDGDSSDYTHNNLVHMMIKILLVTKFEDCLDLVDTCH